MKNMKRTRPYDGQDHTTTGLRGSQLVRGLTFRDIMDCYIRGLLLAAGHVGPEKYEEATKGEGAALYENSLYGFDLDKLDPLAIWQSMACEIEKMMYIYPNLRIKKPPYYIHRNTIAE